MRGWLGAWLVVWLIAPDVTAYDSPPIRIGSKAFTESVILAEAGVQLAAFRGHDVEHVKGLGGTRLLWEALLAGQIDAYPEYTGTMSEEIFAGQNVRGEAALREKLSEHGLRMTAPLGFNNTYIIGMKETLARERGIVAISDLQDHADLILRFSNEFMQRADGWVSLARHYSLPQADVRGLEHALAYEAINKGVIQVTDLYATDAKIQALDLRSLEDDRSYFSAYHAVYVYRESLKSRAQDFVKDLHALEGAVDESRMISANAQVELDGLSERQAAANVLADVSGVRSEVHEASMAENVLRYSREHLWLVGISLASATLVAIPLGVLAASSASLAQPILACVGIIQTIPSIALLVLLIRPVGYFVDGLGYPQAVVALFLYSLLPIVRNTYTGLKGVAPQVDESARALGLPPTARLWQIELPLASRTILAGIKTAAVINVGFATLGGFIGAGGFGEPIFTGIRLNNYGVIMQGAIPAALLAIAVQGMFELVERYAVPKGLRLKALA